jgi:hypothetical protein
LPLDIERPIVGTSGSNTCHEFEDREEAIDKFKEQYASSPQLCVL